MPQVSSVFVIDSWDEHPLSDEPGAVVVRTELRKTFTGDLTGASHGWMTMARAQHDSMAYVGFERITATIDGRAGSFLLQHNADTAGSVSWTILTDSGTDGFTGISGRGQIVRDEDGTHTFTLDYEL